MIFHGEGETLAIQWEHTFYDPRIQVEFNSKGYNNKILTLNWMEQDSLPASVEPNKPRFIALDVFASQKTSAVLKAFRKSKTVTSFIPEGCTGLVQPLGTAINKTLKAKISELIETECDLNQSIGKVNILQLLIDGF